MNFAGEGFSKEGLNLTRILDKKNLSIILSAIKKSLIGRAEKSFLFGSVAKNCYQQESDIDLIIIKKTDEKFIRRAFAFEDLFEIYPRLDILVYTPDEFARLYQKETPFWQDFRESALPLSNQS